MLHKKSLPFVLIAGLAALALAVCLYFFTKTDTTQTPEVHKNLPIKLYLDDLWGGPGTKEQYKRVAIAAKRLGWEVGKYTELAHNTTRGVELDKNYRHILIFSERE